MYDEPEWHMLSISEANIDEIHFFRGGPIIKGPLRWVALGVDDEIIARNMPRWRPEPVFAKKIQDRDLWKTHDNPVDVQDLPAEDKRNLGPKQSSLIDMISYESNDMVVPDDSTFAEKRAKFGQLFSQHSETHSHDRAALICEWDKGSGVFHVYQPQNWTTGEIVNCHAIDASEIEIY